MNEKKRDEYKKQEIQEKETIRSDGQRGMSSLEYVANVPGSGKERAFRKAREYGGIYLLR